MIDIKIKKYLTHNRYFNLELNAKTVKSEVPHLTLNSKCKIIIDDIVICEELIHGVQVDSLIDPAYPYDNVNDL